MIVALALVTVTAWGIWLVPSHKLSFPNEQTRIFYVALGNFVLSTLILLLRGEPFFTDRSNFLLPFSGGLIWSLGGLCAFSAISRIGITRAFSTWAPLNVVVGILFGMLLWGEFLDLNPTQRLFAMGSVASVITGILLIIFSGGSKGSEVADHRKLWTGILLAFGAGLFWGSYFIPNDYLLRSQESVSLWQLAFPLACGILAGCSILVVLAGKRPLLPGWPAYGRVLTSGLLWSLGNFAMLLLVEQIGPGKGFTIAQVSIVVNALCGMFLFREPPLKSRAGALVSVGILFAAAGGVTLGNLG